MAAPVFVKRVLLPVEMESTGGADVLETLPGVVPAGHVALADADFDLWQVDDGGFTVAGFQVAIIARHSNGADGYILLNPVSEKIGTFLGPSIEFDPTTGNVSLAFRPTVSETDTYGITGELSLNVYSWPNTARVVPP